MKKTILPLALLSFIFFITNCKKAIPTQLDDSIISSVLSSYSRGVLPASGILKFVFNNDIVNDDQVGDPLGDDIVFLSPSVKGTSYWLAKNTLAFKPDAKLEHDKIYSVTVNLKNIDPAMGKVLPLLEYTIQTRPFSAEVNMPSLSLNEQKMYSLSGTIETSDSYDPVAMEKMLQIRLNGTSLPVQFVHHPDMNYAEYTVLSIPKDKKGEVKIKVDGAPMNIKLDKELSIELPDPTLLSILTVKYENEPESRVVTSFSDRLKSTQNLTGLIFFESEVTDLRHVIDGNNVYSYFTGQLSGDINLNYAQGIQSENGKKLGSSHTEVIQLVGNKPAVRFVGKGNIIPQTIETILPFQAIGLKSVDIEIFKIFDNSILQFLQTNELSESNELHRVGRLIAQKTLDLSLTGGSPKGNKWTHHAIDLNPLFKAEPNAIYQVRIGFKPHYTFLSCAQNLVNKEKESEEEIRSFYDDNYYGFSGYYSGYWDDREDPCKPAFYNSDHFIARNILVSNIGIIGKASDKNIFAAVTDLRTTDPIIGATVDIYNYTLEKIGESTTDGEGIVKIQLNQKPYAIVVHHQEHKGYLRLQDGNNLNTSAFDVEGQVVKKGLKGFIYTERGIWRPGDSIHLSFILNDLEARLPAGHPVTLKLYDPLGKQIVQKIVTSPTGHIYSFPTKTSPDAPTGIWRAVVKVGSVEFSKSLIIEAVKPNRLKINFDLKDEIPNTQTSIALQSNWLTGLTAKGLTAKVMGRWSESSEQFPQFKDFAFSDPARKLESKDEFSLFDGKLNDEGAASIPIKVSKDFKPSGKMNLRFNIEVSDPSGDFSTYSNSAIYHPYKQYVGVGLPADQWGYKTLNINSSSSIKLASVDQKGKPLANKKLTVGIYQLDWSWWWEEHYGNYANFNSSDHRNALSQSTVTTNANGLAEWKVDIDHWGRYLVRVCDTESGHCAGDFAYAGWPDDENSKNTLDMATLLKLKTHKEKYTSDETVQLQIPAPVLSKMLVTLETGSKVLESHWVTVDKTPFVYSFQASQAMAPAVYAHVSLLQPHGYVGNDMPMRMYGVVPVYIENKESKLEPKINATASFKPDKTETIEISESSGKPMFYTLDIVDEGLLDLTNYKTADPHNYFYSKEALGVQTWDVYNQVLGAFGGRLESILSIGGDEGLLNEKSTATNRFKSPVIHLGPFELKKGEKKKHQLQIHNYVGSVRAMVVAAHHNSYGHTEKTIPVKSAVMVLPTLPRVISAGEKITMPVNLFITDKNITTINLTVKDKNNLLQIVQANQTIQIDNETEKMAFVSIDAPNKTGKSILVVEAKAGNDIVKNEIEIEIRNPNPYLSSIQTEVLEAGATKSITLKGPANSSNLKANVEVATFQPIQLSKHLDYLMAYPYGCAEQTTSAAFPQLFLDKIITMNPAQKSRTKSNVLTAINKMNSFAQSDGSFSLWPGASYYDNWVTSYIGHFLLEAQKQGYEVPEHLLTKWKQFQKKMANTYDISHKSLYSFNHGLDQAYRLYTLALAGSPDLGAMNRLKEYKELGINGKWRLAAAYALAGQNDAAKSLISKVPDYSDYIESGYTYGSPIRDQAMVLETYLYIGDKVKAATAAMDLSRQLGSEYYWNTQGLAFALQALAKFRGTTGSTDPDWSFTYTTEDGKKQSVSSKLASFFIQPSLNDMTGGKILIQNTSNKTIYVQTIVKGQPLEDKTPSENNGIGLSVIYKNASGVVITPDRLAKGEQIKAEITISHLGIPTKTFTNLALTQIVPAGWEIVNDRLQGNNSNQGLTYQDIRDDRIFSFFSLAPGNKKTITTILRATYSGEYKLPAITCEEMYDARIHAKSAASVCLVE